MLAGLPPGNVAEPAHHYPWHRVLERHRSRRCHGAGDARTVMRSHSRPRHTGFDRVGVNQLPELGCYLLAGQPASSRDIVDEARMAEEIGLGATFISERYNLKEVSVLAGAAGAVTEHIRIITAATNHNTRRVMVSAGMVRTMQSLTGGRFTLGIG